MNTGLVLTFIKHHFNRKKITLGVGKGFVDELLEDVFHLIGLKFTSELAIAPEQE